MHSAAFFFLFLSQRFTLSLSLSLSLVSLLSLSSMKEPSLTRRKKPSTKKLELVCSFNGAFRPLPQSSDIRYLGGENRIVSVDRNIGILKLRSMISDLCSITPSFSLKCHLHDSDSSNRGHGDANPPVLIATDEDVWRMIEEYEKLDLYGKGSRLWLYVVCSDNDIRSDIHANRVSEPLCDSDNGGKVFSGRDCGSFLCGDKEVNVPAVQSVAGARYADEISLRKMVLKQQLLAKQYCQVPLKHKTMNRSFGDSYELIERNQGVMNGNSLGSETFKNITQFPLNQRDDNLQIETRDTYSAISISNGSNATKQEWRRIEPSALMNTLNRENIVPRDDECNLMSNHLKSSCNGDRMWGTSQSGIRSHKFGVTNSKNLRACPYHVRSYQSCFPEMGNHRNPWADGRLLMGKYHPGLRPSSNISKQVQNMRLHYPNYSKAWSGSHVHTLERTMRMMDSGLTNQTFSSGLQCSKRNSGEEQDGLAVSQYGMLKPKECQLAYHGACAIGENPSSGGSNDSVYSNGSKLECNKQLQVIEADKSSSSDHNGTVNSEITSAVEISMCNMSLSCSKVETPPLSSITSIDVSEALLNPQSKVLDLMDGGELTSGARVKVANGFGSNANSRNVAKVEEYDVHKEEIQQDPSSSLSIDEKVNIKESHNVPKIIDGGVSSDLASFYTHLATQELQTIKSSDLEYIKELGCGTYGTVYYGKWKGCDVAIKKIKPSCFTDDAIVEDKVVADFWKEAHTLGQLHHPNIVALYGVVTDGGVRNLAAVTEYMVNGSLKQVLKRKDRTIDRRKRLIIAMDAAFGMEYLHEKNIVHFDLKSHNFLVNMRDPLRPVCKIGDLGLSKFKQKKLVSGGVRGTIPWMAPELLNCKNSMVTEKIDVYSFGIVMWELLTGEDPYGKMRSEEIIGGIIKGDLRPEIPSWCDPAWRSLMERCWSSDPNSRPSFSEIAKELRAMSAAMNIK